ISQVLKDAGLPADAFELQLQGDPPVEEHICQYHESDFDFVARWLEREGMYFFFDHSGSREKLIITNHASSHTKSPDKGIRYHQVAGSDASAGESFRSFARAERALVGKL